MEDTTRVATFTVKAHVALNVRNVEQSIEFYRKVFGIEPCKSRPKYAKFDVENPPLNLTLNERPFTDKGALFHLGIQVGSTAEVLARRDQWAAAGLATRDEMQIVCGYALQDKSWVTDPDGNEWEVFVVHQDNLPQYAGTIDQCGAHAASCAAEPTATAEAATCCDAAAPIGIARPTGSGLTTAELSKPQNVCKVFEDEADNALVVRFC